MSSADWPIFPDRHRPVHRPPVDLDNRSIIVFLTVCTKDRQPILATTAMHEVLVTQWQKASHWLVGRYVVLPDHIHLFCAPNIDPSSPLSGWVKYWKSLVAKSAGCGQEALWQKNFWDTQLRRSENYAAKWEYVRNNPVRHRLVSRAEDWPYQGELRELRWHD
jgi:putative transposase